MFSLLFFITQSKLPQEDAGCTFANNVWMDSMAYNEIVSQQTTQPWLFIWNNVMHLYPRTNKDIPIYKDHVYLISWVINEMTHKKSEINSHWPYSHLIVTACCFSIVYVIQIRGEWRLILFGFALSCVLRLLKTYNCLYERLFGALSCPWEAWWGRNLYIQTLSCLIILIISFYDLHVYVLFFLVIYLFWDG